ncbi:hypothetical protein [Plesiocystis pacifica]|nr:hypothetical protein [Plesiocystis pacifica]
MDETQSGSEDEDEYEGEGEGEGEGEDETESDASSGLPGGTCELGELTGQPACDACLEQSCCDLAQACADHPTCGCTFACLATGSELLGCVLACGLGQVELSPVELEPLLGCATSVCLGECSLAGS